MTAALLVLDSIGFGALLGATFAVWVWDLWLDYLDRYRINVLEELEELWRAPTREPTR